MVRGLSGRWSKRDSNLRSARSNHGRQSVPVARRRGVRGRTERSSVTPIIRKGANGSFYDKGLEGASHRAVIPNVNTVDDLRLVWVFYSAQI